MDWTKQTFEIRPPAEGRDVLRYNNGLWTPDDGEWDLAFIGFEGAPMAWYADLPYQHGLEWRFLTTHWAENVSVHPDGNPWHYVLSEGKTHWTQCKKFTDRFCHPNEQAARAAMDKRASLSSCANGRGAEFNPSSRFIREGRLRLASTKEIVIVPTEAACSLCGVSITEARG